MSQQQAQRLTEQAIEAVQAAQWQHALHFADQAVGLAPHRSDVHLLRGIALSQLGQASAAREAFEKAIHLSPHESAPYYNLALHHYRLGFRTEAAQEARRALAADPASMAARDLLAQIEAGPFIAPVQAAPAGQEVAVGEAQKRGDGETIVEELGAGETENRGAEETELEAGQEPRVGETESQADGETAPAGEATEPEPSAGDEVQPAAPWLPPVVTPSVAPPPAVTPSMTPPPVVQHTGQAPPVPYGSEQPPQGHKPPNYQQHSYYQPPPQKPHAGIGFVRNLGMAWEGAAWLLTLSGLVVFVGMMMHASRMDSSSSMSFSEMLRTTSEALRNDSQYMTLVVMSTGLNLLSVGWMALDVADKKENWVWMLPGVLCCACGVHWGLMPIYLLARRKS